MTRKSEPTEATEPIAQRVVASDPIRASFQVTLGEEQVAFLDGPGSNQFLSFPIR